MRQRVFIKLLAAMVLLILVAAGILDISQQNILLSSLQAQVARRLESRAHFFAQRIATATPTDLPSLVQEQAHAAPGLVTVLNRDGTVLARVENGSPAIASNLDSMPLDSSDVRSVLVKHHAYGQTVERNTLYVSVPAGPYIVRLGTSLNEAHDTLRVVRHSLLWATLLALLLATLLAASIAHSVARRMTQILQFAHSMAAGDFSVRIQDNGGDEIAAVAQALDRTAARVESVFRDLQDSRKELEAVLDSMEEAVIAVDAQSRIHWTNRALDRILGRAVSAGSALVQTVRDPDLLAAVDQAVRLRQTAKGRAISVVPGRVFEVSAAPMPGGSAVIVLHDVSEIERVEKTRRDFIANVSHELRTPLTSISGYAETMLEDGTELPAQAREFLSVICRNATRMTRLTDDLLALARIESGEYKLNRKPVAGAWLLDEAAAIFAGLLMDGEIALEREEFANAAVLADSDAILQVLSNLLENAVKYGGGPRIVIGSRQLPNAVEFYVKDFGAGIASVHLGRIFERFYRVDKGRSRESGGTGLGLAIAKHIILAHGGTIRAESDLNQGSTFFFTLPLAPQPAEESMPKSDK
jgi:two-component system, OmpR family, phosphate regulon sensor histidine kinase PhoR